MDSLGHVLNVARVQAAHVDASRLQQVYVEIVDQNAHLAFVQARVREHADLVDDVVPVAGRSQLHQLVAQRLAHLADAARHSLDGLHPLLAQLRCIQDLRHNAGTVGGRIRVLATDEQRQL